MNALAIAALEAATAVERNVTARCAHMNVSDDAARTIAFGGSLVESSVRCSDCNEWVYPIYSHRLDVIYLADEPYGAGRE